VTNRALVGVAGMVESWRVPQLGPTPLDGLLALAVTVVSLFSAGVWLGAAPGAGPLEEAERAAVLLLVAGALSLTWRRRAPLLVLAATGLAFVGYELLSAVSAPLPLAVLAALYTVAAAYPRAVSAGAAGALGVFVVADAVVVEDAFGDDFIDYILLGVVAWTLGHGGRIMRARAALLEQQAFLARSEQTARTRLAVEHERALIARELHDVVAHHVTVVVVQAGAASRVFDAHPEQARTALRSIESVGREALDEMRRLLDVLRPDDDEPDVVPQPGLDQLPALVATLRTAGLPVTLSVRGEPRALPGGVELNAYRIVQEALTNTLRHAGPTRAEVVVTYGADMLELQVHDEGAVSGRSPAAAAAPGRGLVGMRQRAELVGGRLSAGPRDGAGFSVTAALPLEGTQA
jgi:signal transduction histidine kinase